MEYILKLFDENLIRFKIIENLSDPVLQITWINEKKKHLLQSLQQMECFQNVGEELARKFIYIRGQHRVRIIIYQID